MRLQVVVTLPMMTLFIISIVSCHCPRPCPNNSMHYESGPITGRPVPVSLRISPVGTGPRCNQMYFKRKVHHLLRKLWVQFVPGTFPILVLAGSDETELDLPSTHSYGYGSGSRPAFSSACPAPSSRILVKYVGCLSVGLKRDSDTGYLIPNAKC